MSVFVFTSAPAGELDWVGGQSNNSDTLLSYMHTWPYNSAALYLHVFQLVRSRTSHNTRVSPGSKVGKQIHRKWERKREYHMWVRNMFSYRLFFFCFQLCSPTLNEDREQGSALDRGGEGRGRWEFIEELGIMYSGSPRPSCFPFGGNLSSEM